MAKNQNITASEIMEKLEDQSFLCALSGRPLCPANASMDHIHPLSRGGEHTINNVWIVDLNVNSAKGTLSVDEFVQLCRDVAHYQDALDDRAERTELKGSSAKGGGLLPPREKGAG